MKNYAPAHETSSNVEDTAANAPRICLLTETFYPVVGGGETHARLLAKRLNSMGMPTFVLTRRTTPSLPEEEIIDNIPTYRIGLAGMKRMGKYVMLAPVMRELARRKDEYDLIFVCGFRILGIPAIWAARRFNKACVLRAEVIGELSGGYADAYRRLPMGIGPLFLRWVGLRNRILMRADAFVSISGPTADEYAAHGVIAEKIYEIPNGLDTEVFRPVDAETRNSLRIKLGLPANDKLATYSGKLNQGKGVRYLIKAWKTIAESRRDTHLVLVGSGDGQSLSREDEIRAMVKEMGLESRVTFTGYVENVHEYLQTSDIFVFPSENESFGLAFVEAMSCRLPIIACRVGGIPEIVQHGENGILIEPRDPDALAREINRILDHPDMARSLADNAYRTARERYSIDAVAARYFELFCSLSAQKR